MKAVATIGFVVIIGAVGLLALLPFDPHRDSEEGFLLRRMLVLSACGLLPYAIVPLARQAVRGGRKPPLSRSVRVVRLLGLGVLLAIWVLYCLIRADPYHPSIEEIRELTGIPAVAVCAVILLVTIPLALDLRGSHPEAGASQGPAFAGIMASLALCVILNGMARMPLTHHHCGGSAAVGALRTIASVQVQFREGDREGDGFFDYATSLEELSHAGLIDNVLGKGVKSGFVFSLSGSTYEWSCSAMPVTEPDCPRKNFIVCTDGAIRYSTKGPADCSSTPLDR